MIRVLDKNIAGKIAAGQVIERPVSVVKELVENSVDAGSNSITVEIRAGGKKYIRVTDNGCGITKEDAETAFLRHATSKIGSVRDLDAITTLGFRGEALASAAAVSHIRLVSKTAKEKTGVELIIHGGETLSRQSVGCPDGTTVIVTDLFYNTPARAKFLKSDPAESSRVIGLMSRIAVAYPGIRFRLISNGNTVFATSGNGNLHNAIIAVYKLNEYRDLVPVGCSDGKNRVYGCVSPPSLSMPSRRSQFFFVNGRPVSSAVMEKGVDDGYRERLFEGRFPVAFIFIETDPSRLDVNIHPAKREVRFASEKEIFALISRGIKEALGGERAVAEVKDAGRGEAAKKGSCAEYCGESGTKKGVCAGSPGDSCMPGQFEQLDIKQILSTREREPQGRDSKALGQEPGSPGMYAKSSLGSPPENAGESGFASGTGSGAVSDFKESYGITAQKDRNPNPPFDFDRLTLTGSIFGTYITAVDEKNFYLIDQHAAHERVFYEKLLDGYLADEKLRQPVLTPIVLDVAPRSRENEEEWIPPLLEMGYAIEPFGAYSYIIREIPTFMSLSEGENFAREYIEGSGEKPGLKNTVVIDKLIMKSCKSAVKARDCLSMEEIQALICQLKRCRNPFSCPHGRPTFIRFPLHEIEKMFQRV